MLCHSLQFYHCLFCSTFLRIAVKFDILSLLIKTFPLFLKTGFREILVFDFRQSYGLPYMPNIKPNTCKKAYFDEQNVRTAPIRWIKYTMLVRQIVA